MEKWLISGLEHRRDKMILECLLPENKELLRKWGDMSKVLKRSQLEEVSTSQKYGTMWVPNK